MLGLPAAWKLRQQNWPGKALLRKSFAKLLSAVIVDRPKEKFSRDAESMDILATYAHETISDQEYAEERNPTAQIDLHSNEELLYFWIFHNTFGDQIPLETSWRTRSTTANERIGLNRLHAKDMTKCVFLDYLGDRVLQN